MPYTSPSCYSSIKDQLTLLLYTQSWQNCKILPLNTWATFFSVFHCSNLYSSLTPPSTHTRTNVYHSWVPSLYIIFLPANSMTFVWGGLYGLLFFFNFSSDPLSISHWKVQFTFWAWEWSQPSPPLAFICPDYRGHFIFSCYTTWCTVSLLRLPLRPLSSSS